VIAERLTQSFTTTPHFYVTVSVDVSDLLELRSRLKGEGRVFTLTDLISKSVALTLREFPMVNSSTTDGKLVRRYSGIHLGLAVSVEEGLLVPVIHHADRLALDVLHEQVEDLANRARAGKLMPDEMTGSTFTISNMGMLDVENFAAIINPGESAILAVSSVTKTPVVREERVVIRSIMKLTLSADHRLVDGALAARFINAVKKKLEDLELWRRLM
jgi:pyruvate dehydrogenase E2 component (dihydrolipoamide acetyltransferase)